MSAPALRTAGLEKRYGSVAALAGMDLEVPSGCVCGLIGPNGAGKTTTFGVVAGLIRPDSGAVDVFGSRSQLLAVRGPRADDRPVRYEDLRDGTVGPDLHAGRGNLRLRRRNLPPESVRSHGGAMRTKGPA